MIEQGKIIGGRYEIEETIGAGGMSDVYKAKDHTLGRNVAIKVLKREFSQDNAFVEKFRAEAQAAAGLEHPNIVNVYDVGCQDGDYFIVMEYIEGITLKKYIEAKGRLTYKEALSIAIQVGRGIAAAHEKNIIHRDIKPQNIMISTDGKVKVTDFGIARAASTATSTVSSDVMGSVHYSSPEQVRNGYVSDKSDIYSLGIVMYEMVTGKVPFDGESTVSVAIQHLQQEITSPAESAPDLPVSLEKIILKCTQKSPDRRYDSMNELLTDLKKSLINPNEDFVLLDSPVGDKTRVMTEEELAQINGGDDTEEADAEAEEETGQDEEAEEDDEGDDDEDEDEKGFFNKRMEKIITIMGIVAAVVIVIIVIYIVGNLTGLFQKTDTDDDSTTVSEESAETVEVPGLLGMTYEEAEEALEEYGLTLTQSGTEESDAYEAGEIISQDPEEGESVEAGATISVVICAESDTAEVPDVVGNTVSTAESKIRAAGLIPEREYKTDSSVEAGTVISQSPSSGETVDSGSTVTIVVSQGGESVQVPDLSGMSESEAKSAISSAGLKTGTVSQEYSDSVKKGYVISQSPSSGKYVEEGESVDFVISRGAEETEEEETVTTYSLSTKITAPSNVEVTSADIELLAAESDSVLGSWYGVTSFPYSISVKGITEASSGTLVITWYYNDSDGNEVSSVQEESVSFTASN